MQKSGTNELARMHSTRYIEKDSAGLGEVGVGAVEGVMERGSYGS